MKTVAKKTVFLLSSIITVLWTVALFVAFWQGSVQDTVNLEWFYFVPIPLFFAFTYKGHLRESNDLDLKGYLYKLITGRKKEFSNREIYLDYARALAVIFVLLTHICANEMSLATSPAQIIVLRILTSLGLVCNALYVMISGSLALGKDKEERLIDYYLNRFVKVFLPFFICYWLMLFMYGWGTVTSGYSMWMCLKQICKGSCEVAPQYWIIYVFLGLYLVEPFVKPFVIKLSNKGIRVVSIAIISMEAVFAYSPESLHSIVSFLLTTFLRWEGVFILGYFITRKREVFNEKLLISAGLISGVLVCILPCIYEGNYEIASNCSPSAILFATAVLLMLSKKEDALKKRKNIVVGALSTQSFNMILWHWRLLFAIVIPFLFNRIATNVYGWIIVSLVAGTVVCFAVGFLYENTVNIACRYIFKGRRR